MLVNTHKQLFALILLLSIWNSSTAEVWSLQQCIDTAQFQNKNLQMSRNNILLSEEKSKEAKAQLIPKVTANADYKYFTNLPYQLLPLSVFGGPDGQYKEAQFGVPHNINANLQLMMPLYNPQVYGAIQMTKLASELTELQYRKTEEQIFFDISNLYYNTQILHHQLKFIDSNLINAEKLLKNIQLLKEQLLAKGTDVNKVQLQVSQLQTQKENINSKYLQVLNALKFAMGISIEEHVEINPNIEYLNSEEYSSKTTLDVRILKTKNQLLSTELNILNKSRFLPSLHFLATYGTTGYGYNKKPNEFLNFYSIGFAAIQLSYPLFNGTVTLRKINQKKIELLNNNLQSNLVNEQNHMQIENATLQRIVTQKSIATTLEQIQLSEKIYDQIILQHRQGLAMLTDILIADNTLREAQQNYLSSVIEYMKADLELKKLTGNFITIYNK
ncbi:MAG TPA: TolC family protein [Chitinophagales bacterium]|nr:TolC family protein [Chitinophagales bacterium]